MGLEEFLLPAHQSRFIDARGFSRKVLSEKSQRHCPL